MFPDKDNFKLFACLLRIYCFISKARDALFHSNKSISVARRADTYNCTHTLRLRHILFFFRRISRKKLSQSQIIVFDLLSYPLNISTDNKTFYVSRIYWMVARRRRKKRKTEFPRMRNAQTLYNCLGVYAPLGEAKVPNSHSFSSYKVDANISTNFFLVLEMFWCYMNEN